MSIHRRAAKRDRNEPEIVAALRWLGCTFVRISGEGVPDLMVWSRWHQSIVLVEVKATTKASGVQPVQTMFHAEWTAAGARVCFVRSVEQLFDALGVPADLRATYQADGVQK